MAPGTRLLLAAMQEAAILVHVITHHAAISHLHQPLGLYCQRTVRSKCSQSVQVLAMAGLSPSRLQDPGARLGTTDCVLGLGYVAEFESGTSLSTSQCPWKG